MRGEVHQIVTFAREPFRGNPAFVLSIDTPVPDSMLQQVASQLGESVLASLRPIGEDSAKLLFHTPTGLHSGAGHSMLAAAHVQLSRGKGGGKGGSRQATLVLADSSERVVFGEGTRITVPWPVMASSPADMHDALGAALGVKPATTLDSIFGYVAILDDPADVEALDPDMTALTALDRGTVMVTAPGTASDFVIRVFAPKLGLPEDPVCGTAHRILVPYWAERLARTDLHSRQLSARGGDLWCRLEGDRVMISGDSVLFLHGLAALPDMPQPNARTVKVV